MLETKKKRFGFVVAAIWFSGWTIAYVDAMRLDSLGFKWDGWFMFSVLPILIVWGVTTWIGKGD